MQDSGRGVSTREKLGRSEDAALCGSWWGSGTREGSGWPVHPRLRSHQPDPGPARAPRIHPSAPRPQRHGADPHRQRRPAEGSTGKKDAVIELTAEEMFDDHQRYVMAIEQRLPTAEERNAARAGIEKRLRE